MTQPQPDRTFFPLNLDATSVAGELCAILERMTPRDPMAIASVTKVLVASDGVTVGAVSFPVLPLDPAKVIARYRLSPTQLRVAVLLAARLTNSEIADCLGVTVGTVRKHSEWVYSRTNVRKREDLAYVLAACCHDRP